jgi:hypothetical protein
MKTPAKFHHRLDLNRRFLLSGFSLTIDVLRPLSTSLSINSREGRQGFKCATREALHEEVQLILFRRVIWFGRR